MTDTTLPIGTTVAEAEHRAHLRRAVVASTVGTTIEWYDFLIYSTMTGLVFGHVFFSGSDPLIDTLKAFGVFFIGFVARPIGAFVLGPTADRAGRKGVLVAATFVFGVFTLATAHAESFETLVAYRFFAGVGLGGAMPSFISLTSEYSPRRLRAVIVALLWAGFPLGGFVGGLLASWIIPAYGWQSVFWVGGVLPLFVCVVLIFALPESIGFLVASAAPAATDNSHARIFSSRVSRAVSKITFRITPAPCATVTTARMSDSTRSFRPDLSAPILMTMSSSLAPRRKASSASKRLTLENVPP